MRTNNFTIKRWNRLPILSFEGAKMRAFLTPEDTQKLACYHIKIPSKKQICPAFHKKAVELIWILRGKGWAQLNKSRILLKTGDALFIPPFTPHGFTAGSSGMTILAILTPRVDSQTDFYRWNGTLHAPPKVLSGHWTEGKKHSTHMHANQN